MLETDGVTEFTVTIAAGEVTIDPLPQVFRIPRPAGPDVGYMELASFISTADPEFDAVFADFRANGVNDVIIDLRYNGGGLVTTTELLGDYFGGDVAENLIFSETRFNSDRAAANNRIEFFERLGNSMSLSRLVVIATRNTASASEMIANGMAPHVEVTIVGDDTFGKPVGQVGLEFCGQVLRATAFQLFNADGFGDYFDGLPVDCPAADDLNVAVGAPDDPNMVAALSWLDTGACPAAPVVRGQAKPVLPAGMRPADIRGPAWPEFPGTN
jgi:C-terminal processing protease CtpA/Prc